MKIESLPILILFTIFQIQGIEAQMSLNLGLEIGTNYLERPSSDITQYNHQTIKSEEQSFHGLDFGLKGKIQSKYISYTFGLNYRLTGTKHVTNNDGIGFLSADAIYQNIKYNETIIEKTEFHKLGLPATVGLGVQLGPIRPEIFIGLSTDIYVAGRWETQSLFDSAGTKWDHETKEEYGIFDRKWYRPANRSSVRWLAGFSLRILNRIELKGMADFSSNVYFQPEKTYGFCGSGDMKFFKDDAFTCSLTYYFD